MACVYQLEFSNGKKYIGQTRGTVSARYSAHKKRVTSTRNERLYNAWRKYGEPVCKVILICGVDMLNYYESACIKLYDTFNAGYNSTSGGDSPTEISKETRTKLSNKMLGNSITLGRKQGAEERAKKSQAIQLAWQDPTKRENIKNAMISALRSDSVRKKISASNTGKTRTVAQRENIKNGIARAKLLKEN